MPSLVVSDTSYNVVTKNKNEMINITAIKFIHKQVKPD